MNQSLQTMPFKFEARENLQISYDRQFDGLIKINLGAYTITGQQFLHVQVVHLCPFPKNIHLVYQ